MQYTKILSKFDLTWFSSHDQSPGTDRHADMHVFMYVARVKFVLSIVIYCVLL